MRKNFTFLLLTLLTVFGGLKAQTPAISFTVDAPENPVSISIIAYTGAVIDWGNGTTTVVENPGLTEAKSTETVTAGSTIKILGDKINYIALNGKTINSIEFGNEADLVEFTQLYITDNNLTSLDLSKLPGLTTLAVTNNKLTSIDVSKNTKLEKLEVTGNAVKQLDLTKNTELKVLYAINAGLTSLDLKNNTLIEQLHLSDNNLSSIDLSNKPNLTYLGCARNDLQTLDLQASPSLKSLVCVDNKLSNILLNPGVTELDELQCQDNQLSFATLPRVTQTVFADPNETPNFSYAPQDSLSMSNRAEGMVVDLSDEYSISGITPSGKTDPVVSRITFFDMTDAAEGERGTPIKAAMFEMVDGVYNFTGLDPQTAYVLRVEIKNAGYGDLTMRSEFFQLPGVVTSIENDSKEDRFSYTNGVITFNSDDANCLVQLTDISGKNIFVKENTDQYIDLNQVAEKGSVYILTLSFKEGKEVMKVIL